MSGLSHRGVFLFCFGKWGGLLEMPTETSSSLFAVVVGGIALFLGGLWRCGLIISALVVLLAMLAAAAKGRFGLECVGHATRTKALGAC